MDESELATERTDWAEDRTILASERTFASWIRTGLASVGVGLGAHAVFQSFDPAWVPKAVAELFLLVAVGIFWAARSSAARTHARLREHMAIGQSNRHLTLLTAAMTLGTLAVGLILIVV